MDKKRRTLEESDLVCICQRFADDRCVSFSYFFGRGCDPYWGQAGQVRTKKLGLSEVLVWRKQSLRHMKFKSKTKNISALLVLYYISNGYSFFLIIRLLHIVFKIRIK